MTTYIDSTSCQQLNSWHLQINTRESLCFELIERHGRTVFRYGRCKADALGGPRPAGAGVECSAEHIDGIAATIASVQRHLRQTEGRS